MEKHTYHIKDVDQDEDTMITVHCDKDDPDSISATFIGEFFISWQRNFISIFSDDNGNTPKVWKYPRWSVCKLVIWHGKVDSISFKDFEKQLMQNATSVEEFYFDD